MIEPIYFLYGSMVVAVVALLLNIKFRLPKKIFLFLAVLIVVLSCWTAMENPKKGVVYWQKTKELARKDFIVAENVLLKPGVNDFPVVFDGSGDEFCGIAYFLNLKNPVEKERCSNCIITLRRLDESFLNWSGTYFSSERCGFVFLFPDKVDPKSIALLRIFLKGDSCLSLKSISGQKILKE